ncbi:hypothetical protein QWZ12_20900 [Methylobacterium adhaesivum]|uniref:Phospholipase A2 domain-containing protein n=2 Tax=Methylobacterium adhaesivum TaxID=333297 RepID=A0ABT8BNE8_9HYPH|nr:hypothetical protein [Methylobacterium adhaesivum]MDN3593062.1 hypothetical protein [Methylobacterium adhaesivum]
MTTLFAIPAGAWAGEAPKAMLHGNYCGPGNNAPLTPIDALDAACARHDACTPDDGPASKACNLRLQAEAEGVAQDAGQPADLRTMAGVVASGAAMMPSAPVPRSVAPVAARPVDDTATVRPNGGAGDDVGEDGEPPE